MATSFVSLSAAVNPNPYQAVASFALTIGTSMQEQINKVATLEAIAAKRSLTSVETKQLLKLNASLCASETLLMDFEG